MAPGLQSKARGLREGWEGKGGGGGESTWYTLFVYALITMATMFVGVPTYTGDIINSPL